MHACPEHGYVTVTEDGRWFVVGELTPYPHLDFASLSIEPMKPGANEPLTATVLQSLPIGRWAARVRTDIAAMLRGTAENAPDDRTREAIASLAGALDLGRPPVSRLTGTSTVYRRLAEVYTELQAAEGSRGINDRVRERLSDDLGIEVPVGTFRTWLEIAEKYQYLGPGQRGRPGRTPGPALLRPEPNNEESD